MNHTDHTLFKLIKKDLLEFYEEEARSDPTFYSKLVAKDHTSALIATTYLELLESMKSNCWDFESALLTIKEVLEAHTEPIPTTELIPLFEALAKTTGTDWST